MCNVNMQNVCTFVLKRYTFPFTGCVLAIFIFLITLRYPQIDQEKLQIPMQSCKFPKKKLF